MNKQDIFPLYVGKCKVIIGVSAYEYVGLKDDIVWVFSNEDNDYYTYNISDCTLLLKPISEMSEGCGKDLLKSFENIHWNINYLCNVDLANMQISFDYQCLNENGDLDDNIYSYTFPITVYDILTLIQHGYAISDELFTLGIARRV